MCLGTSKVQNWEICSKVWKDCEGCQWRVHLMGSEMLLGFWKVLGWEFCVRATRWEVAAKSWVICEETMEWEMCLGTSRLKNWEICSKVCKDY